jgi:hypothetical protein
VWFHGALVSDPLKRLAPTQILHGGAGGNGGNPGTPDQEVERSRRPARHSHRRAHAIANVFFAGVGSTAPALTARTKNV